MTDNLNEVTNNINNEMKSKESLDNKTNNNKNKLLGISFMGCVTGASLLFGFSTALAMAKKRDTNAFHKGISMLTKTESESGGSLAMRALGWGSLYACTGFTIFCITVWKVLGVNDLQEFRYKMGNLLPRITPKDQSKGRTQFSSVKDLLQYIMEESDKSANNNNNNKNDK